MTTFLRAFAAAGLWGAIALSSGCGGDDDASCTAGTVGCECAEGDRCTAGSICLDSMCVSRPSMSDAGPQDASEDSSEPDAMSEGDGGADSGPADVGPNPDAFFADDPPPMVCLEDGTMGPAPEPPGGTPECPDDKNREGCRCDTPGETAPCWPGRRVNRNRGICMDGTTTCEAFDEFSGRWGACVGAVLPVEGAELGPQACQCFSQGTWIIDNTSPCGITNPAGGYSAAVNTIPPTGGEIACPPAPWDGPPAGVWSNNRLTVDCEGRFELCYTIRAGDIEDPQDTDCIVADSCIPETWYRERGVEQEMPPLPSWHTSDGACVTSFFADGGYGEMSVRGQSVECEMIDDGSGERYVFNRVAYCPLFCNNPADPMYDEARCSSCRTGGSGMF